jgi:hypothetical protein
VAPLSRVKSSIIQMVVTMLKGSEADRGLASA